MASIPGRRTERRQSSAEEPNSPTPPNRSPSSKSIDSSTLFLNNPSSPFPPSSTTAQAETSQPKDEKLSRVPSSEPRKCWICFSDDTEDTPQNQSTWKTPCPCALTAHESCLLDWIADMEAPKGGRSTSPQKEIKCPQCKADIHLARPRSYIVDAVSQVEKLGGQLLLPTVVMGSFYAVAIASSHHGAHSIRMIFGEADADAILAPSPYQSLVEIQLQRYVPWFARHYFRNWRGWRVEMGLPLIPATLIASRTHLLDTLLPIMPIAFFATQPETTTELTNPLWPPSAALTFVVLPYIRSIYLEGMERVWGKREKQWSKEIHPRLGGEERNEEGEGDDDELGDEEDGDMVQLQIEIEEEVEGEDDEDEDEDEEDAAAAPAPPNVAPAEVRGEEQPPGDGQRGDQAERPEVAGQEARNNNGDEEQAPGAQQAAGGQQNNEHQHHHHHRVDISLLTYATSFAETTVGALFLPLVSAAMGEAVRYALPTAWTVSRKSWGRATPSGLLQTRWGRSIVGGCMFVVMKDAVRIYCKYKMAQSYRHRRVMNYDKSLGRVVE